MTKDIQRLREEYARRRRRLGKDHLYSVFSDEYLYTLQYRTRYLLKLLRAHGINDLTDRKILEVGCGSGGVLFEFMNYGAQLPNLHGVDLLFDRVADGKRRLVNLAVACANGQKLPFSEGAFDIVLQFTAFSSVLDQNIKAQMAQEMLRVSKSDGLIIWYDFWLNPTNPNARGINKGEIRDLFRECEFSFKKVTLAPPIARRIVPISWQLAMMLERVTLLNTHYMVAIRRHG